MMKLLRSYFWWSHERGSVHYDILVTLILIFVFVGPRFIDFKARPVAVIPLRSSEMLVRSTNNQQSFNVTIQKEHLNGATTDAEIREAFEKVVEPFAGDVTVTSPHPVLDGKGNVVAYEATITH